MTLFEFILPRGIGTIALNKLASRSPVARRIRTAYQQVQTPPQQRLLQVGSYQQQSYRAERVILAFFAFVFLSILFIMNVSYSQ